MKIYDLRLKSYRTALDEYQPSWDGSVRRTRGQVSAADYAARDLDDLNARYDALVDLLQRRLEQLCAMAHQDRTDDEVIAFFSFSFLLFWDVKSSSIHVATIQIML